MCEVIASQHSFDVDGMLSLSLGLGDIQTLAITSEAFIKKHKLASASSVQAVLKGLLEKDFVTLEAGVYQIYDHFLGVWLKENY